MCIRDRDRDLHKQYQFVESDYNDSFIKDLQTKKEYIASGFRTDFIYERMLTEAFMGLGCILKEELQTS